MPPTHKPGRLEQNATRAIFFIIGVAMASWAPLVPVVRDRLSLNEAQLGSLLLCVGIGSVVTMPFSGSLAGQIGCRKTILAACIVACLALPLMAGAPSIPLLAIGLLAFGAGAGTVDVVMNIQAVIVEKASGRAMMSGFHGLFSVGGIVGAGALTGLMSIGVPALTAVFGMVILSAILLVAIAKGLLPYGSEEKAPAFAIPHGRVFLLGVLTFIMFLSEGSVTDWSGVLLNKVRGIELDHAGLGYVAFAVAMTIFRLFGDKIVSKLSPRVVLLLGGLFAGTGMTLAAVVPYWQVTILGFALVGVGCSNVVPVLFTAAGRQKIMASNLAVAGVSTMGYAGILSGPALIGYVAKATTLPIGLLVVSVMLVYVAVSSKAATAD